MSIVFMLISLSFIMSMTLMVLGLLLSLKGTKEMVLLSPFECGFSPSMFSRPPFSLHFFIIALVFMIFDVELIIMFPLYLHLSHHLNIYYSLIFISFILILMFGLFNEWNQLVLKWVE